MKNNYIHKRKQLIHSTIQNLFFGNNIVIVGSSFKVGSSWLHNMIKDYGRFQNNIAPTAFKENGGAFIINNESLNYLNNLKGHHIFKSHSIPPDSHNFNNRIKFISIYRDLRDAIVSHSYYKSNIPKKYGGWSKAYKNLPIKERIEIIIKTADPFFERLKYWYETDLAFKISYEDLIANPEFELTKIIDYLKLKNNPKRLKKIIARHSFKNRSGRKPGSADNNSFLRKGISGDWKNYFDDALIHLFKTARNSRWNKLLVDMGYENDLNW